MSGIPTEIDYVVPSGNSLPHNHVQWDLAPERAVLLIHDMQRFFVRPFVGQLRGSASPDSYVRMVPR